MDRDHDGWVLRVETTCLVMFFFTCNTSFVLEGLGWIAIWQWMGSSSQVALVFIVFIASVIKVWGGSLC